MDFYFLMNIFPYTAPSSINKKDGTHSFFTTSGKHLVRKYCQLLLQGIRMNMSVKKEQFFMDILKG